MGSGTDLGAVRGLGSSKHGGDHWVKHRVTALGNFVLMLWLFTSLLRLPDYDHATMVSWLRSPLAAVPMALLILSTITHLRMGLRELIEDYVPDEGLKFGALTALTGFCYALSGSALFAIGKIAFSGAA